MNYKWMEMSDLSNSLEKIEGDWGPKTITMQSIYWSANPRYISILKPGINLKNVGTRLIRTMR